MGKNTRGEVIVVIHSANQSSGMKPADMKLNNRVQILELFKSGEPLSANAIAEGVGISRQTVMKAIQFFVEKGILASTGKARSGVSGGKRAELYSLSADQYLFHVLISPDDLYIALFNYRFEMVDTCAIGGLSMPGVDEIVSLAGNTCYKLLLKNDISRHSLRGLCITTSGIVDRSTGRLKFNSLYPNWGSDVPIAEKLSAFFDEGTVTLIENVGKVCGSAYLHDQRLQGKRGLTLFSAWGGVCACLMSGGRILNGKDSLIGEIGHMMLEPSDPEICGCGSHGCFERQVSNDRIRRIIAEGRDAHPESPLSRIPADAAAVQAVFDASAAGDPFARGIVEALAGYFAVALKNITLMFNPDLVVFQGEYARADDAFWRAVDAHLASFHYYNAARPFRLETDCRAIPDVATLGAYTLLIDRLFSDEAVYS